MTEPSPLPTLLSQVLVAFTIELDNEVELQMPHFTTASLKEARKTGQPVNGPWLVSTAMWANFLQFVDDAGTVMSDIQDSAGVSDDAMHTMLAGMTRWGYVWATPKADETKKKPRERDLVVRPTGHGVRAKQIWAALPATIEERWASRVEAGRLEELRACLTESVEALCIDGPPFFPMVNYPNGLRVTLADTPPKPSGANDLGIASLLSQCLLWFTLRFEAEHDLSLAIAANLLRVLGADGRSVPGLPALTGTSKEAVTFSLGYLERNGYAEVVSEGRSKAARLTSVGQDAQEKYWKLIRTLDANVNDAAGTDVVERLRGALGWFVDGELRDSPIGKALAPAPGTWRAAAPERVEVPHHPMVLHRGGYPDGS